MLPIIHTCGRCEAIIPDFIEEGAVAWTSAQPVNDIAGVLEKFGDQIAVIGGYDSNGTPGIATATDDEIDAEVKRCITEYGPYGSYVFAGIRMTGGLMSREEGLRPILAAYEKYKDLA